MKQAVILSLRLSDAGFGTPEERAAIHELENRFEALLAKSKAGELDGDEFGAGQCTIYLYGSDADALFAVLETELRGSPLSRGGSVLKRYGGARDPGAKEARLSL